MKDPARFFHCELLTFQTGAHHFEFILLALNLSVARARVAAAIGLFFLRYTFIEFIRATNDESKQRQQQG
jgi:hypothetical protein